MKDDKPPAGYTEVKASLCGVATTGDDEDGKSSVDDYYLANETRGDFIIQMKPYPIPLKTTTYTDFIFRLPDDLPDLVHIVMGEVINTQPKHLHHFVLTGCITKPDDSILDGVPVDRPPSDCTIPIGGWAPGASVFGNDKNDLSFGVALGRAMGIEALQLNVHYTDGEYNDAENETYKMAEDGIKIYYTPDLRKYTTTLMPLINVPWGPKELYVPPSTERFFLTKTCVVDTRCKDANDSTLQTVAAFLLSLEGGDQNGGRARDRFVGSENIHDDDAESNEGKNNEVDTPVESSKLVSKSAMIQRMMENMSCSTVKPYCFMFEFGPRIQQLCPESCGLCASNGDSNAYARNPDRYRVTAVNYHAHLLGNEMYTTLLRSSPNATNVDDSNKLIAKYLKSREIWYYDDQASIPMDNEFVIDVDSDKGEFTRGVEIKPGDKIQATCVYNSNDRVNRTSFGLSTYDEMCIISLRVSFETPTMTDEIATSLTTELNLRSFTCSMDDENRTTDIWQGSLDFDEDPRDIWKDHPIELSDQCIFNVEDYVLIQMMSGESRNCPADMKTDEDFSPSDICFGFDTDGENGKIQFLSEELAGYTCAGGSYDQKDSNEGPLYITEEICITDGGGRSYDSYSCSDIQWFLTNGDLSALGINDVVKEYIRKEWYQPKCCRLFQSDDEPSDTLSNDAKVAKDSADDIGSVLEADHHSSAYGPALSSVFVFVLTCTILSSF
jgi:hypothetical protein